jgi:hypothetical protein
LRTADGMEGVKEVDEEEEEKLEFLRVNLKEKKKFIYVINKLNNTQKIK